MRGMSKQCDLDILDEIIKLAEGSMAGNVAKKKPDLSVMKVSIGDKKPMDDSEDEGEEDGYSMGMAKDEMMKKSLAGESEEEEKPNFDDMELEDLIEEYKKMKG